MKKLLAEYELEIISALGIFATFGLLWCMYFVLRWFDAKLGAL